MYKIKTEVYATYIPGHDRTVVWQELFAVNEKDANDIQFIQTAVAGWYYGTPDAGSTEYYSRMSTIGQYVDDTRVSSDRPVDTTLKDVYKVVHDYRLINMDVLEPAEKERLAILQAKLGQRIMR